MLGNCLASTRFQNEPLKIVAKTFYKLEPFVLNPTLLIFETADRQSYWLEISLVCDKCDQHNAVYDSYNG